MRMPSPTRPVISDVVVADLGMGALQDAVDRNRLEATNARLECTNAGGAGPGDDLIIVPAEQTPSTPLVSPQLGPHGDSDILEHENPPEQQVQVSLTHQPQCRTLISDATKTCDGSFPSGSV
jgi:hypothetical protein